MREGLNGYASIHQTVFFPPKYVKTIKFYYILITLKCVLEGCVSAL